MNEAKQALVNEVLSRHEALKQKRQPHESLWEDINRLVLPRIADITSDSDDDWLARVAQNKSAVGRNAVRLWSNGMQGYMTPRNSQWMNITLAERKAREIKGVNNFLQQTTEELTAHWRRSNFYDALGPVYEHGASVATSALTVDWNAKKRTLAYMPRHPKQVWIAENFLGTVDIVHIVEELTWRQIVEHFGEDALDPTDRETSKRSPFEQQKVLHAVFPRSERLEEKVDAENKPIASVWILLGRNQLLRESGYEKMREVVWRFRHGPGTPYGTGPSHDALIDLLRDEKINGTMMRAADLSVMPPLQFPPELAGKIKLSPHGMTPYFDPRRKVEPLFTVGSYPFGVDMMERIENAIKQHYHIDFWLMLSQGQGNKTAYEVSQIAGEKAAVMGSEIGRVESELLDPIIDVSLHLLNEQGLLPEPPQELLDRFEGQVSYSYDGPLAQMQKRHYGQQSIIQMLSQVTLIAQVFPDALDWIDADVLMKRGLTSLEAPADVIRDKKIVEQMRKAREAMQQQQMQMAQAQQAAEIQATLSKANPMGGPGGMGGGL